MSDKIKRTAINLETKYKIIKLFDENKSVDQINNELKSNYKSNTLLKIKRQKSKIINHYEGCTSSSTKRLRKSNHPEIDLKLIEFVTECNTNGIPISLRLMKEKANKIAIDLNIKDFKCNDNYIYRFSKRNSIKSVVIHGEAEGIDTDITSQWIQQKLPKLIQDFSPDDTYNGDEFALFWRLLPNRTYRIAGNRFNTGRKSKERISVFICANKSGTDKRKLMVIGKSENPRCFKNKRLPVLYRNNTNAWMTSDLFTEYLKKFNYEMKRNNRKIALIIDNCRSHPFVELSNIKLIFLPPNTTSVLQPMDAGVIHSVKSQYRVMLCQKLIALMEVKPNPSTKDFNLFDSLLMLEKSWSEVSVTTIENCFRKCGFSLGSIVDETNKSLAIDWHEITNNLDIHDLQFEDFVTADDNVVSTQPFGQIIDTSDNVEEVYDSDQTDIYETNTEEVETTVKLIDGLNSVSVLRKCLYQSSGDIEPYLEMIDKIENFVFKSMSHKKQSKITDYFH